MISRIIRYIEDTPWDKWVIENDRYGALVCIVLAVIIGLYFLAIFSLNFVRRYYGS